MVLADTSTWAYHFRYRSHNFFSVLAAGQVMMHPMVLGELACGNLATRQKTIRGMSMMTMAPQVKDAEVLSLIERHSLWGKGIGWVDAHLIASALITGSQLATEDKRMAASAKRVGIAIF